MKFGFAARTRIGDRDFLNSSHQALIAAIPSKSTATALFPLLTDDRTHPPEYYGPEYAVHPDHGTAHTSVVDADGMAVSMTSSVNAVFAGWVLDQETGVLLDNTMNDFSIPGMPDVWGIYPSPYNYPGPHKRPLSSITPLIVEHPDGTFYAAMGGSGGSRIFGAIFQTLLNLDWGMDLREAVEAGRMHDQLWPTEVEVDAIIENGVVEALRERGHNVTVAPMGRIAAVVNAVTRETDGRIFATSDSRKNGIAAGY